MTNSMLAYTTTEPRDSSVCLRSALTIKNYRRYRCRVAFCNLFCVQCLVWLGSGVFHAERFAISCAVWQVILEQKHFAHQALALYWLTQRARCSRHQVSLLPDGAACLLCSA